MDWLKGKLLTGNQSYFPMKYRGFPVNVPLNQSSDGMNNQNWKLIVGKDRMIIT